MTEIRDFNRVGTTILILYLDKIKKSGNSGILIIEHNNLITIVMISKLYNYTTRNRILNIEFDGAVFIVNYFDNTTTLYKYGNKYSIRGVELILDGKVIAYENNEVDIGKDYIKSIMSDYIKSVYNKITL